MPMWDCADGYDCMPPMGGKCVPIEQFECYTDADCPEGYFCAYVPMKPDSEDIIAAGGYCVPKQQEIRCQSDADCPEGFYCEFILADGTDAKIMPPMDGVCVPREQFECWSDADCPEGFYCEMPMVKCAADDPACPPVLPGICLPVQQEIKCWSDADCPAGLVCKLYPMPYDGDAGSAPIMAQPGICVPPDPCICPDVWMPVCGVDGNTYGNACEAACYGVEIAHEGVCETLSCVTDRDCPAGFVCVIPVADSAGDMPMPPIQGICVPDNSCVCPDVWAPVCGVDGVTYGNACEAKCAGVPVAYDGECQSQYCMSDIDCPAGFVCKLPWDSSTGSAPIIAPMGICVPAGPCVCPDIYAPVCGIDGVTYGNACEAACANVPVAYEGECQNQYCWSDADCPAGFECKLPWDSSTGSAPIVAPMGVCVPANPCICPDIYAPVCGIDGVTYGNECEAACAGVPVAYQGECQNQYCWSDADCQDGFVCKLPWDPTTGSAPLVAPMGVCVPRTDCVCPMVWAPVCGVDGVTYDNACFAQCANVEVAHDGVCEAIACTTDADCGPGASCWDGVCIALPSKAN
jgi:hypothetical protein